MRCPVLAWLRSQATMPVAVPVLYEMHLQQKVNESSGGTCEFDSFRSSFLLLQCSSAKALAQSIYHVYIQTLSSDATSTYLLWCVPLLEVWSNYIYIYRKLCRILSQELRTLRPVSPKSNDKATNVWNTSQCRQCGLSREDSVFSRAFPGLQQEHFNKTWAGDPVRYSHERLSSSHSWSLCTSLADLYGVISHTQSISRSPLKRWANAASGPKQT